MLVDRSRFLKLAVAIAATTATTVACSASDDDGAAADGAQAATATDGTAGGACKAGSISEPGAGSKNAPAFAYAEGYCFDLAVSLHAPDREGITTGFFDFIDDHCRAYSSQLQPAIATKVKACLDKADIARRTPKTKDGKPNAEFDATAMYDCGKEALYSICDKGIDNRVNSGGRCDRIAAAQKGRDGKADLAVLRTTCTAVLSGLKSPARAQIEACVTAKDGFDLYTCVEGISEDFANIGEGEARPPAARACVAPNAATPLANSCDLVMEKIGSQRNADLAGGFARSHCEAYLTNFEPAAAKATMECLLGSKDALDNIYACGAIGLKKICQDRTSVDAICADIVAKAKVTNANAGGRLTRQCRTLMPGLNPKARAEVAKCAPERAKSFNTFNGASDAFYSCIESIK